VSPVRRSDIAKDVLALQVIALKITRSV